MARPRLERISDPARLRRRLDAWRSEGLRIGFVPTMGALHEGHLSLVRRAREDADRVVASIFVNPTQFGADEDLDSYPRSVDRDCELLEQTGCDLVFLPSVETIYPPGETTRVDVPGPSEGFEATERPGHFRGVATVVLKLFLLVRPHLAVFGRKDAQQLAVVRRLGRDLHLGIDIVAAPIVREDDGLAMSSRNVYLDGEQRRAAAVLHRALGDAEALVRRGLRDAEVLIEAVRSRLAEEPGGRIDYVAVVDAESFAPVARIEAPAVLPIAVRFGTTRLLDNLSIDPAALPEAPPPTAAEATPRASVQSFSSR